MSKQSASHTKEVVDYYNSTKREYRLLWRSSRSLGIHFGYYDKEHDDHDSAVLNINKKLAELAEIKSKDVVFDAGCGIGGSAIWLASTFGCQVTGVSIVPWQVEKAKSLANQHGVRELTKFQIGDYADTKLESNSFSVVWGLESFVHAEDKQAVIGEAYRLLKPGGRLMICEYLLEDGLTKPENEQIKVWLDGWAMPSILTEKQYKDCAERAGFTGVEIHDWTKQVEPSFARLNKFIKLLKPATPLLHKLRIVNKGQVGNIDGAEAQMKTFSKGLWRYKVVIARKPH